jgi:hypothetical protein
MIMRFLRNSSLILAMALVSSLAAPALGGDYHVGGHGFPRIQGPHFGIGNSNFHRDFRGGNRNRFASGDGFRFDRRDGRNHVGGFGNGGFRNGGRNDFARNGNGIFDRGNGFRSNRPQRLYSTNGYGAYGRSSVNVIVSNQPDYGYISNYAGTTDVYQGNGGTYATGYSYSSGQAQQGSIARPRAKIIDVARMGNVCSNENGVCVIRP